MKKAFYFLLMMLAALACDRNTSNTDQSSPDQLPAATQTGANTFGCKVNGIVFVPNKAIGSTVTEKPISFYGYYIGT